MSTKKYYRQILSLTIFASVFAILWLYWTVGRTIFTLLEGDVNMCGNFSTMRWTVVISYSVLAITLIVIQSVFLVKQLRSIKNGMLFNRCCGNLILWWGIVWFFYDLCAANVSEIIYSKVFSQVVIDGTIIGVPVIAWVFSQLYKMAAKVAEENNLTI